MKTSESTIASSRVLMFLSVAKSFFSSVKLSLLLLITPLLSVITIFCLFAPNEIYKFVHAIAAAPAPDTTIFTSSIFLSTSSKAFRRAAAEIIAVPC